MPEGIDTRGAPNLLIHYDEHHPDTILDHLPCKALVQIELSCREEKRHE
jgi:hypothetical protein